MTAVDPHSILAFMCTPDDPALFAGKCLKHHRRIEVDRLGLRRQSAFPIDILRLPMLDELSFQFRAAAQVRRLAQSRMRNRVESSADYCRQLSKGMRPQHVI